MYIRLETRLWSSWNSIYCSFYSQDIFDWPIGGGTKNQIGQSKSFIVGLQQRPFINIAPASSTGPPDATPSCPRRASHKESAAVLLQCSGALPPAGFTTAPSGAFGFASSILEQGLGPGEDHRCMRVRRRANPLRPPTLDLEELDPHLKCCNIAGARGSRLISAKYAARSRVVYTKVVEYCVQWIALYFCVGLCKPRVCKPYRVHYL